MKWLACLLVLSLAGCAGSGPSPPTSSQTLTQTPAPGSCESLLQPVDARACVNPAVLSLDLSDCVEMRFLVGLFKVVYDLPPGYTSQRSAANPQQVEVSFAHCQQASHGNQTFGPMDFANVGVIIEPVDYGQGEVLFDEYVIENLASSPILYNALKGLGYPVVQGNVSVVDSGNTRTGRAVGQVDYNAVAEITGQNGAHTASREGDHFAGQQWYVTDRDCQYYSLTAPVELTAANGTLVRAMPAAGPLVGSGSQAISCAMTLTFGRSSRENS